MKVVIYSFNISSTTYIINKIKIILNVNNLFAFFINKIIIKNNYKNIDIPNNTL
jgi:hypothetical protein